MMHPQNTPVPEHASTRTRGYRNTRVPILRNYIHQACEKSVYIMSMPGLPG
jgi:hypothetical protein